MRGTSPPLTPKRRRGLDRRDEAIAPAVHRLDKPGYPCLIAQHLAELPHGHREHVLTHHGVGQTAASSASLVTSRPAWVTR